MSYHSRNVKTTEVNDGKIAPERKKLEELDNWLECFQGCEQNYLQNVNDTSG